MKVTEKIKDSINPTKKFLRQSLKLWDTHGYDKEYGGYVEALDFDGKPLLELNRRFRIHPRMIFSHAAGTAWGYYKGLDCAEACFDHIIDKMWQEDGGFATLSDRTSSIIDSAIFTYDHAFVMLAFGWLYKVSGNPLHKSWLYKTWDMLNMRLIHADGGFLTSIPEPSKGPIRLQNPHMHMLETLLNLVELYDDDIWKKAAEKIFHLFDKYFVLPHEKKLREFFNDDWSADTMYGELLEPGHHFEWVWILQKYEKLMGVEVPVIDDLYKFALSGTNPIGLGYNQTDFEGVPTRINHRMWIQTEIIKAHIAMYKRNPDENLLQDIYEAWKTLFDRYLISKHATWYDELDEEGNNISKNSPTSTLYHLIIACNEYVDLAKTL